MSASLHQITVEPYLQMLDAMCGILDKGQQYCEEKGEDVNALMDLRLCDDMQPLRFQLHLVILQSQGVLEAIREGVFSRPTSIMDLDYAAFRERIADTASALRALDAAEIDALSGKPMVLNRGESKIPFTAENFVLSFSLPNLYFHATTAYALLRKHGVPLGKPDFLGKLKVTRD